MTNAQYSTEILACLHALSNELCYRVKLIKATGTQGIADDIRKQSAALHQHAIQSLRQITSNWDDIAYQDQAAYFDQAYKYIQMMLHEEKLAIENIQDYLQQKGKEASPIYGRAYDAHTKIFDLTLKLAAKFKPVLADNFDTSVQVDLSIATETKVFNEHIYNYRKELIAQRGMGLVKPKARI